MTDTPPPNSSCPEGSKNPQKNKADVPAFDLVTDVEKLTAEEQMARYEKDLKENDWGHQPC